MERHKADTAVKLTLQELAYRSLAARFCRSCSNPPLKAKHAMPDKTTGLLHRLLSYADFQGASYSWAHPAFVLLLIFQPMASGYGFQVFLRVAIQDQIRITQWTVCLPVDIPTGWKPRAKQQPTGLIAYGAARRRPVQVLFRTEKEKPVHIVYWFFLVQ